MKTLEILFLISILIVIYTYVGYGLVLYILVKLKRQFNRNSKQIFSNELPELTLMIAAYNEKDYVDLKVKNTQSLNYPKDKLKHVWVTDGSDDGTPEYLSNYPDVIVMHQPERRGKIAAINRAMKSVDTPIVVFSDANTMLGQDSLMVIAKLFQDPKTGCVSGEKRIFMKDKDGAASAGEGIYWKYESLLKKWDAELYSAVGAAGELFSIRTELFQEVEPDTLLDDFIISLRVAMKGYKIEYNPEAYAIESASANVKEELKRKIRISAGGIQSIVRLYPLLNIFKYRTLSFQYISHRVLRWTLAPLLLPIIFVLNLLIYNYSPVYQFLLICQIGFYFAALIGYLLEQKSIKIKVLFIPYYFVMMNYSVYRGFIRYLKNKQSVNWERAKRGA